MSTKSYCNSLGDECLYIGPELDQGPLPCVVYFSLSATDSLTLEPFCTFVNYMKGDHIRIFSFTIPGHEEGRKKEKAIEYWADRTREDLDIFSPFIDSCKQTLEELQNIKAIGSNLALAGLSRGVLMALLLARQLPCFQTIVGFAPMLRLSKAKAFHDVQNHHIVTENDPFSYLESYLNTNIRFYIGNRDTRVGTFNSYDFITSLANIAYEKRDRSSKRELIITNSLGLHGHGTSKETFEDGAHFIKNSFNFM